MTDDQVRLLERYQRFRAVSRRLHNELVPLVLKEVLRGCSEQLGFMVDGTVVFENEEESHVWMDYCIYDGLTDGQNTVTRFLAQQPYPPGSDELLVLQAMAKARYSLYQVLRVVAGLGVEYLDILRGDRGFMIDMGFGKTAAEGVVLAGRLLDLAEFSMSTGAALPIDADTMVAIRDILEDGVYDVGRRDYHGLTRQQEAELSCKIIRCALSRRASSHIAYETARHGNSPPRFVSPNAKCPCGSGRKYKKCCGR